MEKLQTVIWVTKKQKCATFLLSKVFWLWFFMLDVMRKVVKLWETVIISMWICEKCVFCSWLFFCVFWIVLQLNWRKPSGHGLTPTQSAGLREPPPSLWSDAWTRASTKPSPPCSRTTPNTTEVRLIAAAGLNLPVRRTQRRASLDLSSSHSCVFVQSLSRCWRGASGRFLRSGAPQTRAWSTPPPWPPSVTTSSSVTSVWPCCWEPGMNKHQLKQQHRHCMHGDLYTIYISLKGQMVSDPQMLRAAAAFLFSRKMNGTPCIVTKPCRDTMTQFGCPHYSLSHQLLYFMIGKMVRCHVITWVVNVD